MKGRPLVSILINNYNYGHFLREAIDSARKQTYPHTEVIVVDDGSTDNSREIIASYGNQIIPVLKENGGQASTFNAGFAQSQGEIICILDADDIFLPEKVAEVVNVCEQHQDIGWCFHRMRFVDIKTGKFIKLSSEGSSRICDFRSHLKNGNLSFNPPATTGLCFTRSLLQLILPMPEARDVMLSDLYLKLAALALSKGYFLDRQLALQRVHENNRYTASNNNQTLKANIAILTAYSIRKRWPVLAKYTNKLFSQGLAIAWKIGGVEAEATRIVKDYMSAVSPPEKIEIGLRAFYHRLKS